MSRSPAPAINITGAQAINFGIPARRHPERRLRSSTTKIFQIVNNFSWMRGQALLQGRRRRPDHRRLPRRTPCAPSTPSTRSPPTTRRGAAPIPAAIPPTPRTSAIPTVAYNSKFIGLFVQDDVWRHAALQAALRRCATTSSTFRNRAPFAANPLSASFKDDKNNFAPARRLLLVARQREQDRAPRVLRASCTSRRS